MQVMRLTLIKATREAEEIVQHGLGEVVGMTFESGMATIYVEWDHELDPVGKLFRIIAPGQEIPEGAHFVIASVDRGQFRALYQVPYTAARAPQSVQAAPETSEKDEDTEEVISLRSIPDGRMVLRMYGKERRGGTVTIEALPATCGLPPMSRFTIDIFRVPDDPAAEGLKP